LPFLDLLMFNLLYQLSYRITELAGELETLETNNNHVIVGNLIWLVCTAFFGLYNNGGHRKMESLYRATWKSVAVHLVLFTSYLIFHQDHHFSKFFVIVFYLFLIFGFVINRFIGTSFHVMAMHQFKTIKKVALMGSSQATIHVNNFLKGQKNVAFYGSLGGDESIYFDEGTVVAVSVAQRLAKAAISGVKDIFVIVAPGRLVEVNALVAEADKHGIRLKFIPDLGTHLLNDYNVNYLDNGLPIITFRNEPLAEMNARFKKRLFDLIFSTAVFLFLLSWLVPLIAILIKLDSRGPIFFFQQRLGRNNMPFKVFKFRTMKVAGPDDKFVQAKKGDDRVTNIGAFLRKSSLDELPQFINVLLGDMSVVGPRPHPLLLNDHFQEIINKYMVRHFVKPGITGWAQVHGLRGETKDVTDMENRVKYDIYYLENWTAMLDVRIVFMTIINMVRGEENAY
jgi:putative colanic acid biosynthesis UDP-glucose lipid carrier transferase